MHILSRKGYALKSYLHIHLVICHQEKSHLVSRLATDTYLIKIGNRTNTVDFIVMYLVYRITFSVLGSIEVIYRVEFTQTCSRKCLCFGRETSLWPKTDIFWCRGINPMSVQSTVDITPMLGSSSKFWSIVFCPFFDDFTSGSLKIEKSGVLQLFYG